MINVSKLLQLKIAHEIRNGNPTSAQETHQTLNRYFDSFSGGSLIYAVVSSSMNRELSRNVRALAAEGHDISPLLDIPRAAELAQIQADALRVEFAGMISLLEYIDSSQHWAYINDAIRIYSTDLDEGEVESLEAEIQTINFQKLQISFAQSFSHLVTVFEEADTPEYWNKRDALIERLSIDPADYPEDHQLAVRAFTPHLANQIDYLIQHERHFLEAKTLDAIRQAEATGTTVTLLSDLTPEFLPEIPRDPINGESFSYDPETGTLIVPTSNEQ